MLAVFISGSFVFFHTDILKGGGGVLSICAERTIGKSWSTFLFNIQYQNRLTFEGFCDRFEAAKRKEHTYNEIDAIHKMMKLYSVYNRQFLLSIKLSRNCRENGKLFRVKYKLIQILQTSFFIFYNIS